MINLLKEVLANKTRIVAVVSLLVLIAQSYGLDLTQYIGANWQITLTNIFALITLIAIGDNNGGAINESKVIQETSQSENNTTIATQTEDSTTAINNVATQNSQPNLSDTKLEQIKTILNQ